VTDIEVLGDALDEVSLIAHIRQLEEIGVLTRTQFKFEDAELPYDTYVSIGRWLGIYHDASKWWIADWLIFGEGTYTERFWQAVEATGRSKGTVENWINVGTKVPPSRRREELTFTHHTIVAPLSPREQRRFLDKAVKENLSSRELNELVKATKELPPAEEPLDDETPDMARVLPAIRRLLRNGEEAGQNLLCRIEDIVQLQVALGEGD